MKHASDETLGAMNPLLVELRKFAALKERKVGIFYRGSSACVHFHEDPLGVFAHIKTAEGWKRIPVNTSAEISRFLGHVRKVVG